MPSFIYPLEGVYFFFSHPKQLWLKTLSPILLTLIFSAFSIGFSLKVLLPHQIDKLIHWHFPHWMSWFVSIISVILESAILNLLFFAILVPLFHDAVFDATLRARGLKRIFDEEQEISRLVLCWRNFRSSVLVTWVLIMVKIILMVITSPLQLVPVAGTALACYINGWPTAWSQHLHYDIELRGLKVSESYRAARNNILNYTNFGSVAFGLELIPVFNIFFIWTNIVGAALWIADAYEIEKGIATEDNKIVKKLHKLGEQVYGEIHPPSTSANASEQTPLLQQEVDE